jgi:hypothetical protein
MSEHPALVFLQQAFSRAELAAQGYGSAAQLDFIVAHGPAAALRQVAATRELLADLQADEHLAVEDGWYSCAAATDDRFGNVCADESRAGGPCDCGRDAAVERRVRLLAKAWGWTEDAS